MPSEEVKILLFTGSPILGSLFKFNILYEGRVLMNERKTSLFSNGLIWFGAAVSIAEMLTGTALAPLGFAKGAAAIVLGHIIGCLLFFAAGVVGGKTGKSSMETVKISFGQKGSLLFSGLNVLQLVGWTAVMIVSGAAAADAVLNLGGPWVWSVIIGVLVLIWVIVDVKNLGRLNIVAMSALFILTVILSFKVFGGAIAENSAEAISFGAAMELSIAMPLSWLPLISDYTRNAEKPVKASLVSTLVYFVVSMWMYFIGMGAAIYTGESDMAVIMLKSGLGLAALIIIILSTVTTTFLDAFSAGVSSVSVCGKIKEKPAAVAVCIVGTLLAVFTPISQFENFLYLIGSVFAPMISILIIDFFVIKKDSTERSADWVNLGIWVIGFIIYRIFMKIDIPLGSTIPAMAVTMLLAAVSGLIFKGEKKNV